MAEVSGWKLLEVLVIYAFLSGGAVDGVDLIDADYYWRSQEIEVGAETIVPLLVEKAPAVDVPAAIRDLASPDYKTRVDAKKRLLAAGPAATDALEEAAKSDDPEVALSAQEILGKMKAESGADDVRLLMAISTAGRERMKEAVPALEKLVGSRRPFVDEYAREALALMKGEPFESPALDPDAGLADVRCLPQGTAAVIHFDTRLSRSMDIKAVFDALAAGPRRRPNPDEMKAGIVEAVEALGNMRLDAATFGVSDEIGPRKGFVVFILRGRYKPDRLAAFLGAKFPRGQVRTVEGVKVWMPDSECEFVPFDERRVAVIVGPRGATRPTAELIRALKTGKGTIERDADMAALLAATRKKSPGWALIKVTDAYKREADGFLDPYTSGRLEANVAEGFLELSLHAECADAEAAAAAKAEIAKQMQELITELNEELKRQAPATRALLEPLVDFAKTVEVEAKGAGLEMKGRAPLDIWGLLVLAAMTM
jgi:hypothetical protein